LLGLSARFHFQKVDITVDRFYAKESMRKDFDSKVKSMISLSSGLLSSAINVHHCFSMNEECLQVQDFVAGSVFQMLERSNGEYYRIIGRKVISKEIK